MLLVVWFFRLFYWVIGWKARPKLPKELDQYVTVVAPHTSNWDFPLLAIARPILGMRGAKFMAKKPLFDSPIGFIFRWLGGTPVDRSKKNSLVDQMVEKFEKRQLRSITITPEGTRSYTEKWKSGFYHIAVKANVPLALGFIDFHNREVGIGKVVHPSGNYEEDLKEIQQFYESKIPYHRKGSNLSHPELKRRSRVLHYLLSFLRFFLVLVATYLIINFQLLIYGLQQLQGQLEVLYKAQPITTYLEKPDFPDSLKSQIRLIQEIKQFTVDSLGLDPSGSYETLYDQQGKPILWVLTACEPYSLNPKIWSFPLLGQVSYKGFFNEARADRHEQKLAEEGWDTRMGLVNAWSTLGILNDPILSNMLYRSEGRLANLIIHELTHGTIFIKSNITYNENLADFVGDEGAKWFLKSKFGAESSEYKSYFTRKADRNTFSRYVLTSAQKLDSLYHTFDVETPEETKKAKKEAMIERIKQVPDSLHFHNKGYYKYFDDFTPNNAYFMAYKRYREKQNQFKKQYEEDFDSDLPAFIQYMKENYPSIF